METCVGNLSEHQSGEFTKLLYIGNSGSGKTGSLTSLVAAGYKLRILDMDNGLDALVQYIKKECPEKLSSVEYETIRDKYRATETGPQVVPPAAALVKASKLLQKWSDGTNPAEWGADHILVIDTLTSLGAAAYNWAKQMQPTVKHKQIWFGAAQEVVEQIVALTTSETFRTNVMFLSHIDAREDEDGNVAKSFVSSIGKALGPKLPRSFNTMLMAETKGQGERREYQIRTIPTAQLDLKNPAPFRLKPYYPLSTGLAEIFQVLRSA